MIPVGWPFQGFTIESFRWSRGSGSFGPSFLTRNEAWLATTGSRRLCGEEGYTFLEQVWARPTAEVNGFGSGYQGEGSKTIIPSKAVAKLSFRLVPDQDPSELRPVIARFLERQCPDSVEMEILQQHEGRPYLVRPDSAFGKGCSKGARCDIRRTYCLYTRGREHTNYPVLQRCPGY